MFSKKIALLYLLLSAFSVFAQTDNNRLKAEGQVKSDKPSVYLEYVCQDKKKMTLRFYNNTVWSIALNSNKLYYNTQKSVKLSNGKEFYAMPNDREVDIIYGVDKFAQPWENVKVPKVASTDSSSINWVAPSDSVMFSVPVNYLLNQDLQVFVKINYEWELSKMGTIINGPEHRVIFRGIDVPNYALPCAL